MKKIKIMLLLLIAISALLILSPSCYAEGNISDYVNDNVDKLDLTEIEQFTENLDEHSLIGENLKKVILQIINGEYTGNLNDFFTIILSYLASSVTEILPSILSIVAISIIYSLIEGSSANFLNSQIKEIVHFVCYISIVLIIIYWIYDIFKLVGSTITLMADFMELAFPILLTIISLIGGVNSLGVYKPMMSILIAIVSKFVTLVVIPLITAAIIIEIISNLSNNIKLEKLNDFFKSVSKYALGGVFSIFATFLSFQGLTSGIIDTVSIKSAKFAIQNYIPILGGYLSDGYDLIMASLVLIKNSFGVISILVVISIIIVPVVKILILSIALKFVSAVIEPISNKRISNFLYETSKTIMLLISVIIGVFVMFIITIMLIIYSCNIGVA